MSLKFNSGVILAAGTGSRLHPLTLSMNKHMIPVYDRHMIEFPITTLQSLGCKNVSIILGGDQTGFGQIISFLKDGSQYGMKFNYVYQPNPTGIAHAINLCKEYIRDENFVVVLGDNVFEKPVTFTDTKKAQIVLSIHPELQRFGVASILNGRITNITEKPNVLEENCDNFAISGLYALDQNFFDYFKTLKLSDRGEYEITDILRKYHENNQLYYVINNGWWSDVGTFESIYRVSQLIREKSIK